MNGSFATHFNSQAFILRLCFNPYVSKREHTKTFTAQPALPWPIEPGNLGANIWQLPALRKRKCHSSHICNKQQHAKQQQTFSSLSLQPSLPINLLSSRGQVGDSHRRGLATQYPNLQFCHAFPRWKGKHAVWNCWGGMVCAHGRAQGSHPLLQPWELLMPHTPSSHRKRDLKLSGSSFHY